MKTPDEQQVHNGRRAVPTAKTLTATATAPKNAVPDVNVTGIQAKKVAGDISLTGETMNLLAEHKGKLAMGVAATLGLMVFHSWREKRLAKNAPEEYAQLQRLKAVMHHSDDRAQPKAARKEAAASSADKNTIPGKDPGRRADPV
jgi:hypothetical protein